MTPRSWPRAKKRVFCGRLSQACSHPGSLAAIQKKSYNMYDVYMCFTYTQDSIYTISLCHCVYIYIYTYMYTYVYNMYVYIYIYTHTHIIYPGSRAAGQPGSEAAIQRAKRRTDKPAMNRDLSILSHPCAFLSHPFSPFKNNIVLGP